MFDIEFIKTFWLIISSQEYNANVERVPLNKLKQTIDNHVKNDGMHFLHSFDDTNLICGTARFVEIYAHLSSTGVAKRGHIQITFFNELMMQES